MNASSIEVKYHSMWDFFRVTQFKDSITLATLLIRLKILKMLEILNVG